MAETVTKEAIMKHYGWKHSTYYERRKECLASPYQDAIQMDSGRHHMVDPDRFAEFIKWLDRKNKIKKYGKSFIRDRKILS